MCLAGCPRAVPPPGDGRATATQQHGEHVVKQEGYREKTEGTAAGTGRAARKSGVERRYWRCSRRLLLQGKVGGRSMSSHPGCGVGHLAGFKKDCGVRQRIDWAPNSDVCGQGAGQADSRQTGAVTAAAKRCQMEGGLPAPLAGHDGAPLGL